MTEDASPLLSRLTRALAATPQSQPLSARLCTAYNGLLGAQGVSMTIGFAAADRTTLCATDDAMQRAEEAQDVLRQGPSLDAYRTRHLVAGLSDSEQHRRWPMLMDALDKSHGPVRLHAFPLIPYHEILGVLLVCQLGVQDLLVGFDEAQRLAHAVAVAVLGGADEEDLDSAAWSVRDRIAQATGMVVAQLGIPPGDALAVVRAHAFAAGATVAEVAAQVLARTVDFKALEQGESSE